MCIYNYFVENGNIRNHSCPECHVELGVNPLEALRQDSALQTIVDTCFPQFIEEEQHLEANTSMAADAESKDASATSTTSAASNATAQATTATAPPANPGKVVHGFFYSDKVTLKLIYDPANGKDDLNLPKPYVATTGRATVKQLAQFIAQSIKTAKGLNLQPEQVCHTMYTYNYY